MLKTNNKKVKQYFDEYLNNIINNEDYFNGSLDELQKQFYESARDGHGRLYRNYKTFQDAFEVISFNYGDCYVDDIRNTLKIALEETEEEANRYNSDKVTALYNSLLYSAYLRRCKAENTNPHKYFKFY